MKITLNMFYIDKRSSHLTQNSVSIGKTKPLMLFGVTIVYTKILNSHELCWQRTAARYLPNGTAQL
jgi:hypothetical protein